MPISRMSMPGVAVMRKAATPVRKAACAVGEAARSTSVMLRKSFLRCGASKNAHKNQQIASRHGH
ncbi:MAG: hypothetical protein KDA51_00950 [Planctomycetales bacterium]|nr:hypothetical protein [Planctomycetales bacterium]